MTNKTSKFKYGDKVCVVAGVIDPDFKLSIEGWSGEIEEIELHDTGSWMYCIAWDRETLEKAGDEFISRCENENLDYEYIYLLENELEYIGKGNSNQSAVLVA